jgi:hypothetical protein
MGIEKLVEKYKEENKPDLHKYLNYYKDMKSIDDVIKKAACAETPYGKHVHQRRIKNEIIEEVKSKLLNNCNRIANCNSFECIIGIVKENKVKGFGPLAVYDTSLRIGANLGVYPKKVYLHRGTSKGYKALIGIKRLENNCRTIEADKLRDCLKNRELDPYEIEDFLCIYKDCLGKEGNKCKEMELKSCK